MDILGFIVGAFVGLLCLVDALYTFTSSNKFSLMQIAIGLPCLILSLTGIWLC